MASNDAHANLSASSSRSSPNERKRNQDNSDDMDLISDQKKFKFELEEKLSRGSKAMALTFVIQMAEIELNLFEHKAMIATKEDELHAKIVAHRALINNLTEKLQCRRQARSAVADRGLYEEYKLIALKFLTNRARYMIGNYNESIEIGFSEEGEPRESLVIKRDKYAAVLRYYQAKLERKSAIMATK